MDEKYHTKLHEIATQRGLECYASSEEYGKLHEKTQELWEHCYENDLPCLFVVATNNDEEPPHIFYHFGQAEKAGDLPLASIRKNIHKIMGRIQAFANQIVNPLLSPQADQSWEGEEWKTPPNDESSEDD